MKNTIVWLDPTNRRVAELVRQSAHGREGASASSLFGRILQVSDGWTFCFLQGAPCLRFQGTNEMLPREFRTRVPVTRVEVTDAGIRGEGSPHDGFYQLAATSATVRTVEGDVREWVLEAQGADLHAAVRLVRDILSGRQAPV